MERVKVRIMFLSKSIFDKLLVSIELMALIRKNIERVFESHQYH